MAGGDGFYTRQDPTDWAIVYGESQDGKMTRHDLRNGTQKSIRPRWDRGGGAERTANEMAARPPSVNNPTPRRRDVRPPRTAGGRSGSGGVREAARGGGFGGRGGPNVVNAPPNVDPLRFYWNAPFEISPHNPAKLYMAAQYFFKSNDRGDTWTMNPTDLTKNVKRWAPEMSIMGVSGRQTHGGKARRLCGQFARHADSRISLAPRRHLDRHRRRQSAGQQG